MVTGASIGERIGARLEELGLSAAEASRRMGIPRTATIYDWIGGRNEPRAEHLRLLSGVLGMTLEELLGIAEGQDPPFAAWSEFTARLAARGDELTPGEARALRGLPWPHGTEPDVFGYETVLHAIRAGTKPRRP